MRRVWQGAVGVGVAAILCAAGEPGGGDWPCWRGPNGSGAAASCGVPLVADLSEMQLVWRSEEQGIPANCWHNETQGGYDSPIVANGKVFISYFRGTGDIRDTTIQSKGISEEELRWCQAVVTEDIVLCADAATGKTLWKRVLGEGINLYQRRKEGPHQPPCWYDSPASPDGATPRQGPASPDGATPRQGRIYAQSTLARVYCLNDADGKILWQADAPATPHLLKVQAAYKKAGVQHPYRGIEQPELGKVGWPELCMMPLAVADGVVAADGGGALVAFDAATGAPVKWKASFATSGRSGLAPLRWVCDGAEYFIVGNSCVRPKTGEVVWRVAEANGRCTPTIGDGYIVFGGATGGFLGGRIGAGGFTRIWQNNDYGGAGAMAAIGVIYNGWFFAEVHTAGGRARMPGDATELAVGIELATGKVVGPVGFAGVSQTLCTSPVAMDGRWFFHVGAGYSGMVMMDTDPANFYPVGQRMPTVKSWMPLPGGSKTTNRLDFCLTSTPALAGGMMYFRGSDCLWCYDLRHPAARSGKVVVAQFERHPEIPESGKDTLLRWLAINADEVTIEPGVGKRKGTGSVTVRPTATTTYTLTAVGKNGQATANLEVPIRAGVRRFACEPVEVAQGDEIRLGWEAVNATKVTIQPDIGVVAASGNLAHKPKGTAEYVLTVEGPGGPAVARTNIVVQRPRPAEQVAKTRPGIGVKFYAYDGDGELPDFSRAEVLFDFAAPGSVKNLDFRPLKAGVPSVEVDVAMEGDDAPQAKGFAGSPWDARVAAVFTGYLKAPAAGIYRFTLKSDDSSKMYVGNRQVAEFAGSEKPGWILLEAGLHRFRVEYCQAQDSYGLTASWEGPGIAKTVIPPSVFCQ